MINNQVYRKIMSCAMVLLAALSLKAQVYNYDPIRHNNFETNPSYLASNKIRGMLSYIHQGNTPFSKKFAYDEIRVSGYSSKHFTGAGLVFNNTQVNDSVHYKYAGVGAAYRNILFGSIHTRIGFIYKLNRVFSNGGQFSDYTYDQKVATYTALRSFQNANVSISLASSRDTYYASFCILNLQLYGNKGAYAEVAPAYYVLNIGDLGKILNLEETNLSFTAVLRNDTGGKNFSYYIHFLQNGPSLTRETKFVYGLNVGYCNAQYIQYKPSLTFYKLKRGKGYGRFNRKQTIEKDAIRVQYDFTTPINKNPRPYNPSLQFSLTHFF